MQSKLDSWAGARVIERTPSQRVEDWNFEELDLRLTVKVSINVCNLTNRHCGAYEFDYKFLT